MLTCSTVYLHQTMYVQIYSAIICLADNKANLKKSDGGLQKISLVKQKSDDDRSQESSLVQQEPDNDRLQGRS